MSTKNKYKVTLVLRLTVEARDEDLALDRACEMICEDNPTDYVDRLDSDAEEIES
jgi:hypothetical protein